MLHLHQGLSISSCLATELYVSITGAVTSQFYLVHP